MPPTPGVGVGIDRSFSGLPPPEIDSNEVSLDECLILEYYLSHHEENS